MENSLSNEDMRLNPLEDEDFSELTKSEILRWAQILNITPSELYSLSQKDLEQLLSSHLSKEMDDVNNAEKYISDREEKEKSEARISRWQRLRAMKDALMKQQCERLKGGDECRTIWQILVDAAVEIERIYGKAGGSRPEQNAGAQRCCGGGVGPSPVLESILKSYSDRRSKCFDKSQPELSNYSRTTDEEADTSRDYSQQSYHCSRTESGLGVTFSKAGRDGGPSFVQSTRGVDGVSFNSASSRARSADDRRIVKNFSPAPRNRRTFSQSSPIRRGVYQTYMQETTYSPQRNQTTTQGSSGGECR